MAFDVFVNQQARGFEWIAIYPPAVVMKRRKLRVPASRIQLIARTFRELKFYPQLVDLDVSVRDARIT